MVLNRVFYLFCRCPSEGKPLDRILYVQCIYTTEAIHVKYLAQGRNTSYTVALGFECVIYWCNLLVVIWLYSTHYVRVERPAGQLTGECGTAATLKYSICSCLNSSMHFPYMAKCKESTSIKRLFYSLIFKHFFSKLRVTTSIGYSSILVQMPWLWPTLPLLGCKSQLHILVSYPCTLS